MTRTRLFPGRGPLKAQRTPPPPPIIPPVVQPSGAPFLAFTDIDSGPATGNTDTTFGAVSGVDGCYVSVWGNRLGASQGSGTIKVAGVACRVIHWGPAVRPWSPSNLVNGYHDMQIIVFQLLSTTPSGATTIQVTNDAGDSNVLPFTVRTGRILYFTSTGTVGGNGTWQLPYAFTTALFNQKVNQSGDIVYVKDIVKPDVTRIGSGGASGLNGFTMVEGRPGAMVGYPGSVNQFGVYGTDTSKNAFNVWDGVVAPFTQYPEGYCPWWVWAKIDIRGYIFPLNKRAGHTRVVGCTYSNPSTSATDSAPFAVQGFKEQIFGNEFFEMGSPGPGGGGSWTHTLYGSPLHGRTIESENPASPDFGYFPPYVQGQGTFECAWNYLHDIMMFDCWHMYNFNNGNSGAPSNYYKNQIEIPPTYSSYLGGGYFHHNVIVDHTGNGASFTTLVGGDHYVYNNIMIRPGAMVSNADWGYTAPGGTTGITSAQSWGSSNAFRINAGPQDIDLAGCGGPLIVHIWHNTIYDAGTASLGTAVSGAQAGNFGVFEYGQGGWNHNVDLDVRNNVFHQPSGVRYLDQGAEQALPLPVNPALRSSNLWFGAGVPPTWDSSPVNVDPQFTTSGVQYPDVNLQSTSPARGVSCAINAPTIPFLNYDFHGRERTMLGGEDLGAIQFPTATPPSTLPAWMADLQPLEVVRLPNSTIGERTDYTPFHNHPPVNFERMIIDAESGFTLKVEGSVLIWGPSGGHGDGCYNQIVTYQLGGATPGPFLEAHVGSPPGDLPSPAPVEPAAYYGPVGDQIPTGCHNYDRQYFINSQNRYVRIQTTSPYSLGGAPSKFQDCASFDWTTKIWAPPKTIPDVPDSTLNLMHDSTCQDPLTEEIYHWRATTLRKWDPVPNPSGEWSVFMTNAPHQGGNQHPIACNGSEFCMLEMDDAGTVYKIDMLTKVITPTVAVGAAAYGVRFPGLTASQKFRSRLLWIPTRNQYFFMRQNGTEPDFPAGFTNKIFTLTWVGNVCTVEELPLIGEPLPIQSSLGPTARLQYIPELQSCVYAHRGIFDLIFFRVPTP